MVDCLPAPWHPCLCFPMLDDTVDVLVYASAIVLCTKTDPRLAAVTAICLEGIVSWVAATSLSHKVQFALHRRGHREAHGRPRIAGVRESSPSIPSHPLRTVTMPGTTDHQYSPVGDHQAGFDRVRINKPELNFRCRSHLRPRTRTSRHIHTRPFRTICPNWYAVAPSTSSCITLLLFGLGPAWKYPESGQ